MSKALIAAIEANDPEAVRLALKKVKDINRKMPGAGAPLHYACEKDADKVLEALFEAGAIAEKRNSFPDDTPFAIAATQLRAKVLQRLWELRQTRDFTVENVIETAALEGHEERLDLLLSVVKPRIGIGLFRLASVPENSSAVLRLLVKRGGDVNVPSEDSAERGVTPIHGAASSASLSVIRTLVELGADINARDDIGRTPLMMLAGQLEWLERSESEKHCLKTLGTLIDLGADASLTDVFGNDAITYCEFEYARSQSRSNPRFIKALAEAGSPGSGATGRLFDGLRGKDAPATRRAIRDGADVDRVCPPPSGATPLMWADSEELLDLLLEAGADPNQPGLRGTPLIEAAGDGQLPLVKKLVAAGADIHAVEVSGEFIQNACLAAEMNRQFEVMDYLKSLGAGKPKPASLEPLEPGVRSWNDFSELLVKASVEQAAGAIATLINGKAQLDVHGQSLLPGPRAYVVVRPRGLNWCNVFQIVPPRLRFEDPGKTEAFASNLAKACRAAVLSIEYSDTSDAASVLRIEPDGKKARDKGWDRATLEEMVGAMGDEAPAWAKKQLAQTDEDAPDSTERLVLLAEREKFVVAAFGIGCEPGRKVEVEFTGYAADAFDGVAFVSN